MSGALRSINGASPVGIVPRATSLEARQNRCRAGMVNLDQIKNPEVIADIARDVLPEWLPDLRPEPINSEWSADVRVGSHSGLNSDIAACPKSAVVSTDRRNTLS
jgi:hypothetical protein